MDGLECSEVSITELEHSMRIDSEYYQKKYLIYESTLTGNNTLLLGDVADFLIGPFGSAYDTENYIEHSNYRYVRGQDVRPFVLKDNEARYMTKEDFCRLQKYELKENDILVSVVGTLGNACIVQSKDIPAIFSCKSTVIRKKGINPYFLLAYINSNLGHTLLLRKERGAIQKGLNRDDLHNLIIPMFSSDFQNKVEELIRCSLNINEQSQNLYLKAEKLLLREIDVADFSPTEENVAVKNLSQSFMKSGRLDAEYYQPKYDFYEAKIKNYCGGYNKLGDICKYIFTGEYADEYLEKSPKLQFYIRGTNMKNGRIEKDDNYYVRPDCFAKKVCSGDIVTTRVGTLGTFAEIDDSLDGSVCSDNVICFRMPDECKSDVYTLLFNSKPMYELIDRLARGSVQQRLNQETLKQIVVPILNFDLQERLSEMIQNSFSLQDKATLFLDCAVKAVEMAIEQNEKKATAWLDEKIKEIESL